MGSYLTMQDQIMDEMKRPDMRTQVKRAIQSAIRFYHDECFVEAETSTVTPLPCVVGQRAYSLPNDFSSPVSARIHYDGAIEPLFPASIELLDWWDSDEDAIPGRPHRISYYGAQYHLWPYPQSADYAVTLRYYSNIAAPVVDTDEGFWMNEGERLIRTKAKSMLYADVLKDYDRSDREDRLAATEHRRLKGKTEGRHYVDGVTRHL